MTAYSIQINETQRLALLELITSEHGRATLRASVHRDENEEAALMYWDDMLANLPEIEAETPRCLHGFCL